MCQPTWANFTVLSAKIVCVNISVLHIVVQIEYMTLMKQCFPFFVTDQSTPPFSDGRHIHGHGRYYIYLNILPVSRDVMNFTHSIEQRTWVY